MFGKKYGRDEKMTQTKTGFEPELRMVVLFLPLKEEKLLEGFLS